MTVTELKSRFQDRLKTARDLADLVEKEDRDFTQVERDRVEMLLREAKDLKGQIATAEKREADGERKMAAEIDRIGEAMNDAGLTSFDRPSWGSKVVKDIAQRYGRKDLIASGSVIPPPVFDRNLVTTPARPTFLRQIIPSSTLTDSDRFSYGRQTVRDNNAAPVAPGAVKPTSVYTVEMVSDRCRTIAHLSEPQKRQELSDAAYLRDFLDSELRLGLALAEEDQIINGDGEGENFEGILEVGGTQGQVFATDVFSTTRKAVTKLENQHLAGDAWVLNSEDWETIELQQDAEERYYADQAPIDRATKRLWGVPVISTTAIAQGTAILGAFRESCFIKDRERPTVDWSENTWDAVAEASDFQRNLIRFRAEERLGFGITRPLGFVIVELEADVSA